MHPILEDLLNKIQSELGLSSYEINFKEVVDFYPSDTLAYVEPIEIKDKLLFEFVLMPHKESTSISGVVLPKIGYESSRANNLLYVILHEFGHIHQFTQFHKAKILRYYKDYIHRNNDLVGEIFSNVEHPNKNEEEILPYSIQLQVQEVYAEYFATLHFDKIYKKVGVDFEEWFYYNEEAFSFNNFGIKLYEYLLDKFVNVQNTDNPLVFKVPTGLLEVKGNALNPKYFINKEEVQFEDIIMESDLNNPITLLMNTVKNLGN